MQKLTWKQVSYVNKYISYAWCSSASPPGARYHLLLLHKQVHDKKKHCRITACIAVRKGERERREGKRERRDNMQTLTFNLEEYEQYTLEMHQEA